MLLLRFETHFIENFLSNGTKFSIGIYTQIFYAWILLAKRNPGIHLILPLPVVIPASTVTQAGAQPEKQFAHILHRAHSQDRKLAHNSRKTNHSGKRY